MVILSITFVLAQLEGGDSGEGGGPDAVRLVAIAVAIVALGVAVGLSVRLGQRIRAERDAEHRRREREARGE